MPLHRSNTRPWKRRALWAATISSVACSSARGAKNILSAAENLARALARSAYLFEHEVGL